MGKRQHVEMKFYPLIRAGILAAVAVLSVFASPRMSFAGIILDDDAFVVRVGVSGMGVGFPSIPSRQRQEGYSSEYGATSGLGGGGNASGSDNSTPATASGCGGV